MRGLNARVAPGPAHDSRINIMTIDPTRLNYRDLARRLMPAILEAGRIEMSYYTSGASVETKADQSPVTAADRDAEAAKIIAL